MAVYVVTGGYGFAGRALVEKLRADGHDIIVASRAKHHDVTNDNWIEYDLKDHSTIANISNARPDGIFHLAWSTNPATAELNPSSDISINLSGTIALLDHLAKTWNVPIVLVSSGGTVYGPTSPDPICETHARNPVSVYGMTKCAMELYAQQCRLLSALDIRIARVSNPFGSGQAPAKMQGAATIFARKIVRGEKIEIWGQGDVVRDYVDVEDVALGLAAIMNLPRENQVRDQIFNIGSGQGLSLLDLIGKLENAVGRKADLTFSEGRGFDIPVNILNVNKLMEATGWMPQNIDERLSVLVRTLLNEMH